MADREAVRRAVAEAVERASGIDVLVNNAGRVLMSYIEEAQPDAVRALFEVNLMGPLHAIQAVLPSMRRRRAGRIINISSGGGIGGVPAIGLYCASKFAIEGMSEALAREVGRLGIRVTIVEPGAFRTELLAKRTDVESAIGDYAWSAGTMRTQLEALGGTENGDPDKLAAAVLALADADDPPMRIPLNDDAIGMAESKAEAIRRDIDAWRHIAGNLSFDALS